MQLKLKLITLFLVITIIPFFFIGLLGFYNARGFLLESRTDELGIIADCKIDKIENFFGELQGNLEIIQNSFNLRSNLPIMVKLAYKKKNPNYLKAYKTIDEQLLPWIKTKKEIVNFILVAPSGEVLYIANEKYAQNRLDNSLTHLERKAFEEGQKGKYLSEVFKDQTGNHTFSMLTSVPVYDFNNTFIGILIAEIDMDQIYKMILNPTGLGETGETCIVQKKIGLGCEYVLFLSPLRNDPKAALKRTVFFGDKLSVAAQRAANQLEGSGITNDYRNKTVLSAWRYIPLLKWGLVTKIDIAEVMDSIVSLRQVITLICLIVFGMAGLIGYVIADSITRPIHELQNGTEIIGSGNLDFKVGTEVKDEIGQLSRAFDKMTENLKETIATRDGAFIAQRVAESSSKAKSDFLANMSHELRTPLNSIIGFSEVLEDETFGSLNQKQKECVGDVLFSGRHLLALINDILDLAKVESGKMELSLSDFSLKELLQDSLILIKEKAWKHNLELIVEVADEIGIIKADERRLKQIIFNGLSNAIKFTPDKGKIGIKARIIEGEIEISIWDTGIGIAKEDQAKLFREFSRIENPYTKQYQGTGLGLSLTKKLVELHNGKIWIESEGPGKGSNLKFTIPFQPVKTGEV